MVLTLNGGDYPPMFIVGQKRAGHGVFHSFGDSQVHGRLDSADAVAVGFNGTPETITLVVNAHAVPHVGDAVRRGGRTLAILATTVDAT